MESATITLNGSLSHTVRMQGQPEIKFLKGRPYPTSDPKLIVYAKANPSAFSVTLNVIEKPKRSAEDDSERPSQPPAVSVRQASGRFTRKQPVKSETPDE